MKLHKSLLVVPLLLLTACSDGPSVEELTATITEQDDYIADLETKIENYEVDWGGSSLKVVEGATTDVFEYVDSKFVLPEALYLEGSTEDVNSSYIQVGSSFRFAPSNNWVLRQEGVTLNVSHPLGVIGTMKALNVEAMDFYEVDYKRLVSDYVATLPSKQVKYSNLFVGDLTSGAMATATINFDGREGYLVTGFLRNASSGLTFSFVVDSNDNTTALEMVRLFLSSGIAGSGNIRIE